MAEHGFREIQLSGKQLVFLFIAATVLAVAVFLLGVSVGRGTPGGEAPGEAIETVADVRPSTELPPTTLSAADTEFDEALQGKPATPAPQPTEPATPVDEPAATPPASTSTAKPTPQPATAAPPPASTSAATAKPATSAAATPPSTAKPASADSRDQGWMLQVGAFKSRENADSQVRRLISKGYSAVVVTGGSLFRVRVGPYAQKADADRAAARLQKEEGLSSSVTR